MVIESCRASITEVLTPRCGVLLSISLETQQETQRIRPNTRLLPGDRDGSPRQDDSGVPGRAAYGFVGDRVRLRIFRFSHPS